MLSIEEINLLIEKLERAKEQDFKKLIETNLKILKDIKVAVDANNQEEINRVDKTKAWYAIDNDQKRERPVVEHQLYLTIQKKIMQFAKDNKYNSLEIGPGTGMFFKEFRSWRLNYFLELLPDLEQKLRRRLPPLHQKYLKFFNTQSTECDDIPAGSCNFVFSWDTFVFFTQNHVQHYLHDIKRVLIPGGYVFMQYADCHFDRDLSMSKTGYWAYNTKTAMTKMIEDEGYEVVEMNQFKPGANYAIFRKPGKQNPVVYKIDEIKLD